MARGHVSFVKIGELEFSRPEPLDETRPVDSCEATIRRGNLQATLTVRKCQSLLGVFPEAAKGVPYEVGNLDVYGFSLDFKADAAGHVTITINMHNPTERWTVSAKIIVDLDDVKQASRQMERFLRLQ